MSGGKDLYLFFNSSGLFQITGLEAFETRCQICEVPSPPPSQKQKGHRPLTPLFSELYLLPNHADRQITADVSYIQGQCLGHWVFGFSY